MLSQPLRTSVIPLAVIAFLATLVLLGRPLVSARQETAGSITRLDGHPDLSGIWQTLNEANWDLEAHDARPAAITQKASNDHGHRLPAAPLLPLGAAAMVPASQGVVQGDGRIPYRPEALARKRENAEHWVDRDPELRCSLPGVPRATYIPSPFQMVHGARSIEIAYQFSNGKRTIHLDDVEPPAKTSSMGHSVGRWDGDTLVVTVSGLSDKTWFDRAGNFHSSEMTVTERYTPRTADAIWYEATINDPHVFTRPWTIAMSIYRRLEPNAHLMENRCVDFIEEFLYGGLGAEPLVTHWESETMVIDLKRRMPRGDRLYWYRR